MLNPFKKKENEFKLDEYELPSLSNANNPEAQSNNFATNSLNTPSSNNSSSSISDNNLFQKPVELGSNLDLNNTSMHESMPKLSEKNSFSPLVSEHTNNSQISSFSQGNSNPILNSNSNISSSINSNELIKVKIESIENKMILSEARISNIENKLELIYQILLAEVSDETKQRFSVNSMMNTIKNK